MKFTFIRSLSIIVTTALLMCFSLVLAQGQEPSEANMEILREKVRADKKLLVAQNMQLAESEAAQFWPVYNEYQKALEKLATRHGKIIEDYANNYANMTDDVARRILDAYLAGRAEHVMLMQSYLPKFREVLPERKVTRYYQIENKIDALVDFELAARIPLVK